VKIQVRVKPNSKSEEVNQDGDSLVVRVKAPPREGKANQAVIRVLAKHFGVPQSRVKILAGARSKDKFIEIVGEGW